ncbi:MAG: transcription-repair coupling factor [Chlorobi bacterium]|nr:transcription-repair coupling factor [Chlorobiota bacterium]MCI0716819.1 transcription-repair coupling factor [Chlorobiota bacterium]
MLKELLAKIYLSKHFEEINSSRGINLFFTGLRGSLISFVISCIYNVQPKIAYLSNDEAKLFKIKDDINLILANESAVIYLDEFDEEYESEITPLSTILKKLFSEEKFILLSTPKTLEKPIISEETFREKIISIKKGNDCSFEDLISKLLEFKFTKKRIVEEENDFAVRGGIIDIFPDNLSQPVRVEFFGNTVESIREFDLTTQRSITQLNETEILPSFEQLDEFKSESNKLHQYIKEDSLLLIDEPDLFKHEHEGLFYSTINFKRSFFSGFPLIKSEAIYEHEKKDIKEIIFDAKSQPHFNSNTKLLYGDINGLSKEGCEIYITCTDDYQVKRTKELIEDIDENNELINIKYLDNSFHGGFILPNEKIAVYTEHEVFGRYFRPAKRKRRFGGITFKELTAVNYGDFMVHQNFGIGKYAGLKKITTGGVEQEAVKLLYKDNDTVFVNLNSLHLIKKFSSQEGVTPALSKLGGSEWERIKKRTKKKIQDIARDLILLYSKRKTQKGFKFSTDAVWQKELEASFIYEDTPDQISATESIKQDMQSEYPMDRLVCGDVGFGKTEVAVRAAFKAVLDNKQASVLVPTTILAEQHYNTFKDRLSSWAVEVEHLSRFKTRKEQKEILKKLEDGKINIIIGTHRLLSKDIKFKDLGLLVIDEEQRFGVKAKEKLKFMRENVDVLTLTATPIPRTLNFSLLGARDLSIINTPPKNRQPIHTEIINFDKKLIANAVIRELQRDGQVYFVNDKISKLDELASIIEETVPYAKVAIAHGQMQPAQLESVMMKFLEKKFNVLVCTKIIESGLDIPSVNTIIINRADNFGLAELYQLRGRVGRSNIKSYAYLITPPHSSLTKQAIRRLHALEEFSELGSGMNLALKDLEIRGAGNLLGREQSGFISEIGFDMYMLILDEAVGELKETELAGVIADVLPRGKIEVKKKQDVIIESDISMYIPESYIDDENSRLEIYQRLSKVSSTDELSGIRDEMIDRFGKLPAEVESLFKHIIIKLILYQKGFEKIVISGNSIELFFNLKDEEMFSNLPDGKAGGYFERIINYINSSLNDKSKLKQTKSSLSVEFKLIFSENHANKLSEI